MAKEQEYALKRIDEWYLANFRRNITREITDKLKVRVKSHLDQEEVRSLEGLFGEDIFGMIDFDFLSKFYASNPFSKGYAMLAGSIQDFSLALDMLPEGVKSEYMQPTIDSLLGVRRLFDGIVEGVRKKADEIFPDELTDRDVRRAFMDSTGGLDNYCGVPMMSIEALLVSLNLAAIRGAINQEQYQQIVKLFNTIKEEMPEFTRILFKE